MTQSPSPCSLKKVLYPISDTLILICERCGSKICDDPLKNPSRELQKNLKAHFKEKGQSKQKRPLVSSCLALCPENEIAIAKISLKESLQNSYFSLAYENEAQATNDVLTLTD